MIASKPRYQMTPMTFMQNAMTRMNELSSWEGMLNPRPYSIKITMLTPRSAPMPKSLNVSDHSF